MERRSVDNRARIYGQAYDARQRDPVVDVINRASVANGRMSQWERFNRGRELVYVHDAEGHPRGLTPKQLQVFNLAREMIDGRVLTMREMSAELRVNVSTVSRALAKLMAWGLLVYRVGRGRLSGLVIVKYVRDIPWREAARKAAKARIRSWSEAAQRRISRLALNVAPYINEEGVRVLQGSSWSRSSTTTKGATLTVQRKWTPEELRSLGIL